MTYTFNLIDQSWIPCINLKNESLELNLRDVILRAHELRGIQGDSPLETAALYRLILAVLHSALRGPKGLREWTKLWEFEMWDMPIFDAYFKTWHNSFDLFAKNNPFFQTPDKRVKPKSIISLAMDMASGNNASLFDHHTEVEGASVSPAKAARILLVGQWFGLAGTSGVEQKFTDGPWTRGIIFLVEGDNLFQTLVLNLLNYPDELTNPAADLPAWENENPFLPDRAVPHGYLDYLTWQSRKVFLLPEGDHNAPVVRTITIAPGLRMDPSLQDKMKLYKKGEKEGKMIIRFSEDRALWRDSAVLFGIHNTSGNEPPKSFERLAQLATKGIIPQKQVYRFMALGMANDQAKVDFFQENHLPLPLDYLERDELVEKLSSALTLAENVRFRLRVSAQWLALLIISPKADGKKWPDIDKISKGQAEKLTQHWAVERSYWQNLELPFFNLLETLPENPAASMKIWRETLEKAAWHTLDKATDAAGEDPASMKAAVRARSILGRALKELFEDDQKEVLL